MKKFFTLLSFISLAWIAACGQKAGPVNVDFKFDRALISAPYGLLAVIQSDGEGGVARITNTSFLAISDLRLTDELPKVSGAVVVLLSFDEELIGRSPVFGDESSDASLVQVSPKQIFVSSLEGTAGFTPLRESDSNAGIVNAFASSIFVSVETPPSPTPSPSPSPSPTPSVDTEAPSAPMNLIATAFNPMQIDLAWEAATDNVGVVAYRVYRIGPAGNPLQIAVLNSSALSYSNSGMTGGTTRSYEVKAEDAAGNLSVATNRATATTPIDTTPPPIPTDINITNTTTTSISLSWDASVDEPGGSGLAMYRLYRKLSSNVTYVKIMDLVTTSFTDSTLAPLTGYDYKVTAVDAAGNESNLSSASSATGVTLADTSPPTDVTDFQVIARNSTTIELTWTFPTDNVGLSGYEINRNNSLYTEIGGWNYKYIDLNCSPGTSYTYNIRARDAAGNFSSWTAQVLVATSADNSQVPSTPANATASLTGSSPADYAIAISWSPSTPLPGRSIGRYRVYELVDAVPPQFLVDVASGTAFNRMYAESNRTYRFQISAIDDLGFESVRSTATILITVP